MRYQNNNTGIGCFWPTLLLFVLFPPLFFNLFKYLFAILLFSPVLIVGGMFLFLLYNKKVIKKYVNSQTQDHNKFVELLIGILVKIAKVDGKVDKAEIKAIREYFQYQLRLSREELLWTKELIKEALNSNRSIEELCAEFKSSFNYEPRLILAGLMYKVAFADGSYSTNEKNLIERIIVLLGISEYHHRTIKSQFLKVDDELRYYATLGLEKGASFSEIKKAYRDLSMQYHPDKVAHLGAEFLSEASAKMKEINEAYAYLKNKMNAE